MTGGAASLLLPSGLTVVGCTSVVAITIQAYDMLLTFPDEVHYIWSKPNTSFVKWVFLFMRYFALASITTSRVLLDYSSKHAPFTPSHCLSLYIYELVAGHLVFLTVEIILMLRVFLLYDRSRNIRRLFVVCWSISIVLDVILNHRATSRLRFDEFCFTEIPTSDIIAFSITGIFTPFVLMLATLFKWFSALRNGWGRTPLLVVLVRDGFSAFTIILAVWITILIMACVVKDQPTLFGHYLFLGVVPSLGCRVVINLQRMGGQDRAPQLTSVDLEPPASESTFALGYRCHQDEEYTYP